MNVFAYCTAPAWRAVATATGITPVASPPVTARTFEPIMLEGHDLLYFRLHQVEAMPTTWLGEDLHGDMFPALHLHQVEGVYLNGAAVVIANCYSQGSPFVPAFYENGAGAVIGAHGKNYAAGNRVIGSDLLVLWIIRLMGKGLSIGAALAGAKTRLLTTAWRRADRDALGFQIIRRIT